MTTYYKVTRKRYVYGRSDTYDLMYMDAQRLMSRNQGWWSGEFSSSQAAIDEAEGRGWVQVKTWKEARVLAAPEIAELEKAAAELAKKADEATFTTGPQIYTAVTNLVPGGRQLIIWMGKDQQLRMVEK